MSKINQQVIADQLGLSRTTVSRCFTNHPGINPATRSAVFSLAAKLGYRYLQPRSGSRATAVSRSIGVLICGDADEFHAAASQPSAQLLPGVSEFAQLHQWHTEVHFVSPQATSVADAAYHQIDGLHQRSWSGLILMRPFAPGVIDELAAAFPCVSLAEPYHHPALDTVDVNHHRGIDAIMERFRQNGHARIGFLSLRDHPHSVRALRRFGAYLESLVSTGQRYREQDVVQLDPAASDFTRVLEQTRDGVTAWLCAADRDAYGLISALKQGGFHVPRDVSVAGFNGSARPIGGPLLDTVRVPYYEIGFAGGRRLHDKINKRFDSSQEILLDCRLEEGETIGPCRPRHRK